MKHVEITRMNSNMYHAFRGINPLVGDGTGMLGTPWTYADDISALVLMWESQLSLTLILLRQLPAKRT